YAHTDATHRIAMERLAKLVAQWLQTRGMSAAEANALLASDYAGGAQTAAHAKPSEVSTSSAKVRPDVALPQRQARHLAS
ncbi:B12-binding domain-containing radical SAM protein, partial [Clostridioides difficile]